MFELFAYHRISLWLNAGPDFRNRSDFCSQGFTTEKMCVCNAYHIIRGRLFVVSHILWCQPVVLVHLGPLSVNAFEQRFISPLCAKFFRGNINIYLQFVSFLHIDTAQVVEILPQKNKNLPILRTQYHGCWCPGDVRSQGISSHDIDLVKPR